MTRLCAWCEKPMPTTGSRERPCGLPAPLPNPTAARLQAADGFCQDPLRVYVHPAPSSQLVALRSQRVLTGSGSPAPSYGGLGEATPHSTCMAAVSNLNHANLTLSAREVDRWRPIKLLNQPTERPASLVVTFLLGYNSRFRYGHVFLQLGRPLARSYRQKLVPDICYTSASYLE
jgi:hypothetical protein